jgi:hypothetical protein
VLAASALAGCIDEPRPFRPALKPLPAELATPEPERSIIVVTVVEGVTAPLDRELSDAMVKALEARSLPVMTDAMAGGHVIYHVGAHFAPASSDGHGPHPAAVIWEVWDESGELVSRHAQPLPLGASLASAGTKAKLIADIAREPADMVVKGIEGDAPLPVEPSAASAAGAAKPGSTHSLAVDSIKGSPAEDGDAALRQTIEYALKTAGVRVVESKAADSLLLDGAVMTSRLDEAFQHVKVTWSVKRADGTLIGEVSQENNVPTRLLTRVWGEIASTVAQNAAQGIAALIEEAERSKAQ